ncbi:hypothetical protein ACFWPK_18660 [Nocardia sp. NPDC058519]|uniref:hypothetical protein n=1 Tax=Nocardia sp. NPDC058519 TaxID=3346535 RepID=UPI00365C0CF9
MTPEILDRIVASVRTVLDDHVHDRDVYAWRFTMPVDASDPVHRDLESQWRGSYPGLEPSTESTYEIALSLVGDPADLTDADIADLEHGLAVAVYGAATPHPAPGVPFTLRAHQRTDVVEPELDHELR